MITQKQLNLKTYPISLDPMPKFKNKLLPNFIVNFEIKVKVAVKPKDNHPKIY